ncbi:hypothetical protein EON65_20400, partial [archaeon]
MFHSLGLSDKVVLAAIKLIGIVHFPGDLISLHADWDEFKDNLVSDLEEDELAKLHAFCQSLAASEAVIVESDDDDVEEESSVIEGGAWNVVDLSHITLSAGTTPTRTPAPGTPDSSMAASLLSARSGGGMSYTTAFSPDNSVFSGKNPAPNAAKKEIKNPLSTRRMSLTADHEAHMREQEHKRRAALALLMAQREAKQTAVTQEAIKQKREEVAKLLAFLKSQTTMDLVFLTDCTGSMQPHIDDVKDKIGQVEQDLKHLCPDIALRLAFVGYRDYRYNAETGVFSESDKQMTRRLDTLDFTTDVSVFEQHISRIRALGGDDVAEDVLGGLNVVASKGWWESAMRVLIHIGDAPCHGLQYNGGCQDNFPAGDPNGLLPLPILQQLQTDHVKYIFLKLNDSTDNMLQKFNAMVAKGMDVDVPAVGSKKKVDGEDDEVSGDEDDEEDAESADETKGPEAATDSKPFIEVKEVVNMSAMDLVSGSLSVHVSLSVSSGTARAGESATAKQEVPLVRAEPDWTGISEEQVTLFALTTPTDLEAMIQQTSDSCTQSFPLAARVRVQVAKDPFASGADCLAYYGRIDRHVFTSVAGEGGE